MLQVPVIIVKKRLASLKADWMNGVYGKRPNLKNYRGIVLMM